MKNNKGFALLETAIAVFLLAIFIVLINPGHFIKLFNLSKDRIVIEQTALEIFHKFEIITSKECTVLIANTYDTTLLNNDGTYKLFAYNYPDGQAPFKIAIVKDSQAALYIAEDIALLASPDRPGLEFKYRGQDGLETSATANIEVIDLKLTFKKNDKTFEFSNSFSMEPANDQF
jgi:hypothetical protein